MTHQNSIAENVKLLERAARELRKARVSPHVPTRALLLRTARECAYLVVRDLDKELA